MAKRKATKSGEGTEEKIFEIGESVWKRIQHQKPSIFDTRWLDERLLDWAMQDESIKVQLFRFVDVLPMLRDHEAINRHLHEYFEDVQQHLPWAARLALHVTDGNRVLGRALAYNARSNAQRMARRFIAGTDADEIVKSVLKIRDEGFASTLDRLGEAVLSPEEADQYQQAYLTLLQRLPEELNRRPGSPQVDRNHVGEIPRCNLSLKLSALDHDFNPTDPAGTTKRVLERLRPILHEAMQQSAFINIDMEHYHIKDLTNEIIRKVFTEKEFKDYPHFGVVCQAYLKESEEDLKSLLAWVKKRKTPITVRLVKGAYWDYETVIAGLRNWPVPVFENKTETDSNFESLTTFLMQNYDWLSPAIGSHNLRSLSHAVATAATLQLPRDSFELQMLYGMARDQAQAFSQLGYRVRIYTPFGEMLPGMSYLVRRLLENTSNDSFLRQSHQTDCSVEELLMSPKKSTAKKTTTKKMKVTNSKKSEETSAESSDFSYFQNEPWTDFSRSDNRELIEEALASVQEDCGHEYPVIIGGKAYETRQMLHSRSPSQSDVIVGRVSSATIEMAEEAIATARRSLSVWNGVDADHRAEYLELIANGIQERRFELSAWIITEVGKTWEEADAEVAEAIDFCRYYAESMRSMEQSIQVDLPGEENAYSYRPRGVAVVIAPWNFPLAILTGMTSAALVTGNTVVMKPAEQSPVIAAKLMEIIRSAGIPDGVVNFLPGNGEEIGPALVESPDVDVVVFTGSREVGLEINQRAAETTPYHNSVKRVIAEMGGKNAIIVDDDADLDEAVHGILMSAFGYSGQKCSACSRVIVLKNVYEEFSSRLKQAFVGMVTGPAENPGTRIGPVIDEDAMEKINSYIQEGLEEAECLASISVDAKQKKQGYFVEPHIFHRLPADSRLIQEEIFGPVLCLMQAKDFAEALKLANETPYALTGGVYSRSPQNLNRARQDFLVGNLYLNRPCTAALVSRQPFGGLRMSGIGSKAGGPDYLHQFLIPVNVTENTIRRGFAPETAQQES